MTSHSTPATFTLSRAELSILGQTVSPIDVMEEKGGSIWVTSNGRGQRTWIVESDDTIVKIVIEDEATGSDAWTYPLPEQLLMAAQRFMYRRDSVQITLDDDLASFTCDAGSMSIPQRRGLNPPPITPLVVGGPSATVDEGSLCAILESASFPPIGAGRNHIDPPMHCRFDFDAGQLEFVVDWSLLDAGIRRFTIPATFDTVATDSIEFVLPHYQIWCALNHPMATREFDNVTITAPGLEDEYMHVGSENWELFIRALPDVQTWGHDLDKVTGPYAYTWIDCGRVEIHHPRLRDDSFTLRVAGKHNGEDAHGHQLVHRLTKFVINGPDLTTAIHDANTTLEASSSRARVQLENDALILKLDVSAEEYAKLSAQIDHLAEAIDLLPPMKSIESMWQQRNRWMPLPNEETAEVF